MASRRMQDQLYDLMMERRECVYRLEEADALARVVQAQAENHHLQRLRPWTAGFHSVEDKEE